MKQNEQEEKHLRDCIRSDIANSLGLEHPPAFLTEREIALTGFRSIAALQFDRVHGRGMQWCKVGGLVKYQMTEVVNYAVKHRYANTAQCPDSTDKLDSVRSNLKRTRKDLADQNISPAEQVRP